MTAFEIPLKATPQSITITMGGLEYQLTIHWNDASGVWLLDIADGSGNKLVSSISLVTGTDLLGQFAYLNFGGMLVVQTDNARDLIPTFANLGDTSHLYFVVQP